MFEDLWFRCRHFPDPTVGLLGLYMIFKFRCLNDLGYDTCLELLFVIAEFVQLVKHFLKVSIFNFVAIIILPMILSEHALVQLPVVFLLVSAFT